MPHFETHPTPLSEGEVRAKCQNMVEQGGNVCESEAVSSMKHRERKLDGRRTPEPDPSHSKARLFGGALELFFARSRISTLPVSRGPRVALRRSCASRLLEWGSEAKGQSAWAGGCHPKSFADKDPIPGGQPISSPLNRSTLPTWDLCFR